MSQTSGRNVIHLVDCEGESRTENGATPINNNSNARSAIDLSAGNGRDQHKSGMFTILYRNQNRNARLQCNICQEEMWHTHARDHIAQKHQGRLAEYDKAKSKTIKDGKLAFSRVGEDETAEERAYKDYTKGTLENLRKQIARFIVLQRQPFQVAESQELHDLLRTTINYALAAGRNELDRFKPPCRRLLVDDHVEGEGGLLQEYVDKAVSRFKKLAPFIGTSIIFDGAKDVNGRSLELFCLQCGSNSAVLWTGLPHDSQKNVKWTTKMLKGLLGGSMDFDLMGTLEEENGSKPDDEDDRPNKRAKRTQLVPQMQRLFDFTKYVFAVGGDNANVPVMASKALERDEGVIAFGCVAHAFSRCFQHIAEIQQINSLILKPVEDITDLFLTKSMPRELLRAANGKSVDRIVPTRFVSLYSAVERLIELESDLVDCVSVPKFQQFKNQSSASLREQIARVVAAILDAKFWARLKFFLRMMIGFVVAVRCMDGAKAGAVCLVYKMWNMLAGTVAHAFLHGVDSECSHFATPELYQEIKRVIVTDWTKFHFPIYSAAYLLTPHFADEVMELNINDPCVFERLRAEMVHCLTQFHRRFDELGNPRESILCADDPELEQLGERFKVELSHFIKGTGNFLNSKRCFQALSLSPSTWWEMYAFQSILRPAAVRLLSLSPTTAPVERLHKVTKSNRTKARNCLGYARALGLNFICAEHLLSNTPPDVEFAWKTLEHYKERFTELSSDDREYLKQVALLASREAAAQAATEEDMVSNVDLVNSSDTGAEESSEAKHLADGWDASNAADIVEADEENAADSSEAEEKAADVAYAIGEAAAEPPSAPLTNGASLRVSSRGRLIRPKVFHSPYAHV